MGIIETDDSRFVVTEKVLAVAVLNTSKGKNIMIYLGDELREEVLLDKEDVKNDEYREERFIDYARGVWEEFENRMRDEVPNIDIVALKKKWMKKINDQIYWCHKKEVSNEKN